MSWMDRTRERIRANPTGAVVGVLLFVVVIGFLIYGGVKIPD